MSTESSNNLILTALVGVVTAISGYLFNKTGLLNKWSDFIFISKTKAKELELLKSKEIEAEIARIREKEAKAQELIQQENVKLRGELEKLNENIHTLEKLVEKNNMWLSVLVVWLEKSLPPDTEPFIMAMVKEIKEHNKLLYKDKSNSN